MNEYLESKNPFFDYSLPFNLFKMKPMDSCFKNLLISGYNLKTIEVLHPTQNVN